jgi:hypothetical protein
MRELIGRLAVTDGDAASALRVIAHFDALSDQRAPAISFLRAAAALADCSVGLRDAAQGSASRVAPTGLALPDVPAELANSWPRILVDENRAATVWLERSGDPGPLDQLILERCAHGLRPLLRGAEDHRPDSAAAVRIACDRHVSEDERRAALRSLGVGEAPLVVATPASHPPKSGHRALIGASWALLLPGNATVDHVLAPGSRAGVAHAGDGDVPAGWSKAAKALSLAVDGSAGGPHQVRFEDLGDLVVLAEVAGKADLAGAADVQTLERLRQSHPWVPATIYQVVGHQSVRSAAVGLHVHHSTLQQRVEWLERELGYSLREPAGRFRAATAWTLWRCSGAGAQPPHQSQ